VSEADELSVLREALRDVARAALASPGLDAGRSWALAAELGWLALEVPEALGGAGASFAETAVVLDERGRALAPGPFVGTAVLGVAAAVAVERGSARDELLARIAEGTQHVAVAFSPSGDAAVAAPGFTLRHGRLHGVAHHVVDAPSADSFLLLADAPDGPGASDAGPVVVSLPASALRVSPRPVLDTTRDVGSVAADAVEVPDEQVWRFASDPVVASQQVIDRGAVALALDALGVAGAVLDATVAYVAARRQFDRVVGSFQAVKHQCADVLVEWRVARALLGEAVAAITARDPEAPHAAARAKSYVGTTAVRATGVAMQLHGGIGYTWESGIHRSMKRALLDRALLGAPAAQRARLGEALRGAPRVDGG
jgi:alkylation response protein AidB-like acyl-CoA dehydrogenase